MDDPIQIDLLALPPVMAACVATLKTCGATHYALFGGAVRDADYAARYAREIRISDYDIRIWLPFGKMERVGGKRSRR